TRAAARCGRSAAADLRRGPAADHALPPQRHLAGARWKMNLLSLKGVSLGFAGSQVLNSVDFDVPANSLVSLIGPNGAGKTSLFNCITGFYKPQSGSITLDGTETLRLKPHQVTRLGIERTFQNVRLFREMTVLENVMSGQHCRTGAGIIDAILRLPTQEREE